MKATYTEHEATAILDAIATLEMNVQTLSDWTQRTDPAEYETNILDLAFNAISLGVIVHGATERLHPIGSTAPRTSFPLFGDDHGHE